MKQSLAADIVFVGITFVWGTTFIIVQNILGKLTPLTFNTWRFLLAAMVLFGWQMFFHRKRAAVHYSRRLVRSGAVLGSLLFIGYACQTIGLLYTSASNAAFITGLSVVLVPILSALFLKKVPPYPALIGVVLAAVGLYLLTTKGLFVLNRGDWIVLICAVAFASHIVCTARFTEQYSSLSLTIVQLTVVAVFSFFIGLAADGTRVVDWRTLASPEAAAVLLFMALFATAFAILLQTALQKKTSATHVGLIYIMEPVFAAWTSVVFQNAQLRVSEWFGCALILAGMLLAEWPVGRRRTQP
ncbi:DMT family transporter [Sporolactobacillus sp. THM7-7]|nr:DMT family transporter [Sporolactobacillus sp. THM7-7]